MWEEYKNSRSQDLPELIHDAGQCYFFNLKRLEEKEKRLGYMISRHYSQDIDSYEDLEIAEKLFSINQKIGYI